MEVVDRILDTIKDVWYINAFIDIQNSHTDITINDNDLNVYIIKIRIEPRTIYYVRLDKSLGMVNVPIMMKQTAKGADTMINKFLIKDLQEYDNN